MQKTITNPIIKDEVSFIQTAKESNGQLTHLRVSLMPGGGTPLHFHQNFSETFQVLEGTLTITLEKKKFQLTPSQKITVEKGAVHRFSNESNQPVVFNTFIEPGSTGFENSLRILYGLAADKATNNKGIPKSLLTLAVVSKMSDMHPVGLLKLFTPLFGYFNRKAEKSGIDQQLINKYCR